MKAYYKSFVLTIYLAILCLNPGLAYMIGGNPYSHRETLDPQGKYQLEWTVDWIQKRVTFNVTVNTQGYIGFGLSDNGKMTGADIVIGGISPEGQAYFIDAHAVGNQMPVTDPSQNWKLHEVREDVFHTFLSFSRDFDTCDPQDYQITEDKVAIIWSYGQRDEISYHHQNRGVHNVYLLNPDYSPRIDSDLRTSTPLASDGITGEELQVWTISSVMEMPESDTTYWCTMHKAPELTTKHHVVGMDVRFSEVTSRKHVHHILVYKCNAPRPRLNQTYTQNSDLFSNFLPHRGQQCLSVREPTGPMPTEFCTELFMGWAVGGRSFFQPPHVGIPLGSSPEEHYLLQVHYDNPNLVTRQRIDVKIDFFYTIQLRPHEGGMLNVRHTTPGLTPSLLIPPSSISQRIHGICGSHCTREILPKQGIHIYGLTLHSHNSGKRMKLHHFRQTRELPWITSDENFGNDYQQFRVLHEERTVLPWDILVMSCEYDNTWTNGTVVGGYATRQEMCAAFLFYYNKLPDYQQCSSEIGSPGFRRRLLGVRNITWSNTDLEFLVDDKGHPLRGMKISEVSDNHVDWTIEKRNELQKFQLTSQHVNWCFKEIYAGGPVNTPETELIPPRPKRQKQPSRSIGKRKRRQTPTTIPRYEPEWQDPRRFSHYPKNVKPYVPPRRTCKP